MAAFDVLVVVCGQDGMKCRVICDDEGMEHAAGRIEKSSAVRLW